MTQNELAHHGILGQKWGIRRYQNKDGSLTEAGKKHIDKLNDEQIAKYKQYAIDNGDIKSANEAAKIFNNDEINALINRYTLNKRLSDLADPPVDVEQKMLHLANKMGSLKNIASATFTIVESVAKVQRIAQGKNPNWNNDKDNKNN